MKIKNLPTKFLLSVLTLGITGIFLIPSKAQAISYFWQFSNDDGNVGLSTDIVQGFVEFDDADVFPNATDVAATRIQVTSITNLPDGSSILFSGDGAIELGVDIPLASSITFLGNDPENSFDFNSSEEISSANVFAHILTEGGIITGRAERLELATGGRSLVFDSFTAGNSIQSIEIYSDNDSGSLTFSSATAVPFEFTPTLSLLLVGGISGLRYFKHKNQEKRISKL